MLPENTTNQKIPKKLVIAEAFPSIPVVFVGGIRPDRIPNYNTMGMAVTTENEDMKTTTSVEIRPKEEEITFLVGGKQLEGKRGEDTLNIVKRMLKIANLDIGLRIESKNQNIFSGSSDSGICALVAALNELAGLNLARDELIEIAMSASESAIRSYLGGLSETNIDEYPKVKGIPVATADELKDICIYALTFPGERHSADEIHKVMATHPEYIERVIRTPAQVRQIKDHLNKGEIIEAFRIAELNIQNAHYLLESAGLRVRRKDIINACIDIEDIRRKGFPLFYLMGGGNQISIISLRRNEKTIEEELRALNYDFRKYKIAPGVRIVRSE